MSARAIGGSAHNLRGMEVLGNQLKTSGAPARPLKGAGRVPLATLACLGVLAGCTSPQDDNAVPPPQTTTQSADTPATAAPTKDLEQAAQPALDLLQRHVPSGYASSPVVSGYDWASTPSETIKEQLSGDHILQVACSGNGQVTIDIRASATTSHLIPCGSAVTLPLIGPLDATITGQPPNTGVATWRVLPRT